MHRLQAIGIGLTAALTNSSAETSEAATEKSTLRALLAEISIGRFSLFDEPVIGLTLTIAGGVPI
ncbi:hypothetical protein [Sphingomicrobium lutaoense]|uniref:Uncharacterized protein n=1 Tax=Sphingomicrobium lutaoense TaxID=515949 RepID=A0A839Z2F8_9SPHN|nr:hypothetical protein [Sphingomicrobium lutaoense]MBB3764738.1 hypothetical protein [Sphingomicrobium lutaoense]